jgi:endo-alpha-1,4-polygalactosaminidase (GH114 family)
MDDKPPIPGAAKTRGWRSWSTRKKFCVLSVLLLLVVALAVGLGVGLGIGLNQGSGGEGPSTTPTATPSPLPTPPTTPGGNNSGIWRPKAGTTWQIELLYPVNDTSINAEVYDIDLFNNTNVTITQLHSLGRKVVCYFSAGSYEDWRPDASQFKPADLGDGLKDWPGEKWLNLNSTNVRNIMKTRMGMAVDKGCDGVDPDNVDAYDNNGGGLGLTEADSIDFVNFLATEAQARNLSIGLKNAGAIIPDVIDKMQWSVNEQCAQYQECDTYAVFPGQGKPVFHIEYPKGVSTNNGNLVTTSQKNSACTFASSGNFSTILKNMDLDNWIQTC